MLAEDYYKLKDSYSNCLIGGFFFLFILLIFFAVGNYMLALQIKANSYTPTDAVVVDYVLHYERDNSESSIETPTYYNVVEYEIDGELYRKTCDTPASTYNAPNDLGKVITIYVNPDNPKDVVFRNSTHILLITVCYVVPIGGFVAIAFVFRKAYKIKKILKEYD